MSCWVIVAAEQLAVHVLVQHRIWRSAHGGQGTTHTTRARSRSGRHIMHPSSPVCRQSVGAALVLRWCCKGAAGCKQLQSSFQCMYWCSTGSRFMHMGDMAQPLQPGLGRALDSVSCTPPPPSADKWLVPLGCCPGAVQELLCASSCRAACSACIRAARDLEFYKWGTGHNPYNGQG
jgi:hypothetical protein